MTALLAIEDLHAGYGVAEVLFGVDLTVEEGSVTALLGRNGMGKTTTVRSLMGLIKPRGGRVSVGGRDLTGATPHAIAKAGIGLVPEGREVFPTLSVEENLIATSRGTKAGAWTLERVFRFFPRLAERKRNLGSQLSGGEQQMLAIGRALMTNPRILVLDEATEGLAPLIRAEIWDKLSELKRDGLSILVIDKNLDALSRIADRHVVLDKGEVVWRGEAADLAADPKAVEAHLHL
ncbi:MAG: ABC transporter ATP-binding protein [Pseudomonadota bacterium]